jgi:TNF receptor-associated protein 1
LVSAETSSINFDNETKDEAAADVDEKASSEKSKLSDAEGKDICEWLKVTLGQRVREVKVTHRLSDSPAIVTDHESGALRRMMRMVVRRLLNSLYSNF